MCPLCSEKKEELKHMAHADPRTIDQLRLILENLLKIENDWYNLKHKISDTDLKDPIADAFCKCRDRLQSLVDSL